MEYESNELENRIVKLERTDDWLIIVKVIIGAFFAVIISKVLGI